MDKWQMKNEEFEEQLDKLKTPGVDQLRHQQFLKVTLLNAKRSSRIGIAIIIIPCLFIMGQFLRHWFGISFKPVQGMEAWMSKLDDIPTLKWVFPFILIGLPLISVAINALSVLHFYLDRSRKEMLITVKWKPLNLLVLFVSILILAALAMYAIRENVYHEVLEKFDQHD
jgi:hypothetical protein